MRIAVLSIGLLLMVALGVQSCTVAVGGGLADQLSTTAADEAASERALGSGLIGVFAALLWLVGAACVLIKPRVSMIVFAVAAVVCLIGGALGFVSLFVWAVVSAALSAFSWRGIEEKERKDLEDRRRYEAHLQATAAAQRPSQNPPY